MTMRPLTIAERGLGDPTVSLTSLLAGEAPPISGTTLVGLADYTDEILRSGFPGIRDLPERARNLQLDSYVDRILEREMPEKRGGRPPSCRPAGMAIGVCGGDGHRCRVQHHPRCGDSGRG